MSLFRFETPVTRPADLAKAFNGKVSQVSLENLTIMDGSRNRMVEVMRNIRDSESLNPLGLRQAIEDYLPSIATCVMQSVAANNIPVSPSFVWRSVMGTQPKGKKEIAVMTYTTFQEDCLATFVAYGLTYYQEAYDMLQPNSSKASSLDPAELEEDVFKEAAAVLKIAAGVFTFIYSLLIPQMVVHNPRAAIDHRLPMVRALADMCMCNAQEMVIKTAIKQNKSGNVLSKLALGLSLKFTEISRGLATDLGPAIDAMNEYLREYISTKGLLYEALARRFYAKHLFEVDTKYGPSVALYKDAADKLAALELIGSKKGKGKKRQYLDFGVGAMQLEMDTMTAQTKREYEAAKSDNDQVYYDPLPDVEEIELPQAIFMIKPTEYNPPQPLEIYFFATDPKSDKRCVVS